MDQSNDEIKRDCLMDDSIQFQHQADPQQQTEYQIEEEEWEVQYRQAHTIDLKQEILHKKLRELSELMEFNYVFRHSEVDQSLQKEKNNLLAEFQTAGKECEVLASELNALEAEKQAKRVEWQGRKRAIQHIAMAHQNQPNTGQSYQFEKIQSIQVEAQPQQLQEYQSELKSIQILKETLNQQNQKLMQLQEQNMLLQNQLESYGKIDHSKHNKQSQINTIDADLYNDKIVSLKKYRQKLKTYIQKHSVRSQIK